MRETRTLRSGSGQRIRRCVTSKNGKVLVLSERIKDKKPPTWKRLVNESTSSSETGGSAGGEGVLPTSKTPDAKKDMTTTKTTAKETHTETVPQKKRGIVLGFSRDSRARLRFAAEESMEPLIHLKPGYSSTFITLTYPGKTGWDDRFRDVHLCQEHLVLWWKRLVYTYHRDEEEPGCWMLWCLELQSRESCLELPPAWHFHGLLHWRHPGDDGDSRRAWVSRSWAEVVAGKGNPVDEDHLRCGTNMKPIDLRSLPEYLGKAGQKIGDSKMVREIAKRSQKSQKTNGVAGFRWWGVMGKKAWLMDRREPESAALETEARVAMDECRHYLWDIWAKARGIELENHPKTLRGYFLQIEDAWMKKHKDYPRFAVFAKRKDVQELIGKITDYGG